MHYSISEIIVLFFTYSVVGWLWETFYCSIKDHHYAYRGFLFGPYCPVYGFAVTTILITAEPVSYTHLDVYKRQIIDWIARPSVRRILVGDNPKMINAAPQAITR